MADTGAGLTLAFRREHRRLSWAAIAAFGVLPAFLCVLAAMLVRDFSLQTTLRAQLHASDTRRSEVQYIFSLLKDAETGQRGYLLTGDSQYLKPYQNASSALPAELSDLQSEVGDSKGDAAKVAALSAASRDKLAEMAQTLKLYRMGHTQAALQMVRSNHGRAYMDRIRALVAELDAQAAQAVALQSRNVDVALAQTVTAAISLGVVYLITLVISGTIIRTAAQHRRRLFTSLEEVATRQTAVLHSAVDAIVTLDPSGTIETVNPAGERLFGYDAEDLIGHEVRLILELDLDPDVGFLNSLGLESLALDSGARAEGGRRSVLSEGAGVSRDGRRFPVDIAFGPMELQAGTHVVAIIRDISERRRAEEIKDQFISAVSHELRTPLTSITGSLGLLAGGAIEGLPEGARRLVSIAYNNSDRLGRLVNDILDIEKIQSGRLPLAREPFDLKAAFRNTAEEMDGYARKYGVTVVLVGDPSPVWALGDEDRVNQVAANLISNAVKFSPAGGEVRISFGRREGTVQASVGDTGPGVPDSFRSRIFTRFAQADTSDTRQRGGTGLGLAICKEIVDRHGGDIFFKSEAGEGTRFFVNLPASAPPGAAGAGSAVAQPAEAEAPRVLICEDDLEMCEFLEALARAEGARPETVHSLKQARIVLSEGGYACALLDLTLPDGSGLDFLRAFKLPTGRPLPVVIVSAEERRRLQAVNPGLQLVDWVEKPLDPRRMRQTLRAALETARKNAAAKQAVILHIEDDPDVVSLVADLLKGAGETVAVSTVAEAKHALAMRQPDVVILDLGLAGGSGLELLPFLTDAAGGRLPTVIFSALESKASAGLAEAVLTKSKDSLGQLSLEVHRLLSRAQAKARRKETV